MDDTKYEIPEDLKAAWDVLPQNCWERQLIERIARLSAPVSDEEMNIFALHRIDLVQPDRRLPVLTIFQANALLAARQSAKEPQP